MFIITGALWDFLRDSYGSDITIEVHRCMTLESALPAIEKGPQRSIIDIHNDWQAFGLHLLELKLGNRISEECKLIDEINDDQDYGEAEHFYYIDSQWHSRWKNYVEQKIDEEFNLSKVLSPPGPIDNV
jgi:hypothetical protein